MFLTPSRQRERRIKQIMSRCARLCLEGRRKKWSARRRARTAGGMCASLRNDSAVTKKRQKKEPSAIVKRTGHNLFSRLPHETSDLEELAVSRPGHGETLTVSMFGRSKRELGLPSCCHCTRKPSTAHQVHAPTRDAIVHATLKVSMHKWTTLLQAGCLRCEHKYAKSAVARWPLNFAW